MPDLVSSICEQISKLASMRYPTMLVVMDPETTIDDRHLRAAAEKSGLRLVDYRTDVLDTHGSEIPLGAYHRAEFRDWLRHEAQTSGGLLVYNADELISSWSDGDRRAFFLDFLHIESNTQDGLVRAPIVLASYLASRFALPQLGQGQGIVWRPESE